MKILTIENEYASIKPVFSAIECIVFKNALDIRQCDKSQDIPWDDLNTFDAIFVDISLATKSNLDGCGILEQIKNNYPSLLPKVAIITGNDKINEMLKERNLDDCPVRIFEKPLRYKEIAAFIKDTKTL
mgnify:FL=1